MLNHALQSHSTKSFKLGQEILAFRDCEEQSKTTSLFQVQLEYKTQRNLMRNRNVDQKKKTHPQKVSKVQLWQGCREHSPWLTHTSVVWSGPLAPDRGGICQTLFAR